MTQPVPTLYQWAGGMPAFERLTEEFYRRIPDDSVLADVFKNMPADHPKHVAAFIAEVLGGPRTYSEQFGSHSKMIRHHFHRHLTEAQRRRWVDLLLDTSDDVGLPTDPEFRSAFLAYIEWGTRLAVINSQEGAIDPPDDNPMPKWGWGVPGGPYQP